MLYALREATIADAPAIELLENELFPENGLSARSLQPILRQQLSLLALDVLDGHRPAGYALAADDGVYTDLMRLGVRRTDRRRGLATKLLNGVPTHRPLLLTVDRDNPAVELYLGQRFKIVGIHGRHWVMVRVSGC